MEETLTQLETPGGPNNRWWNRINPRDNIKETLILIVITLLVLGGGSVAWNASRTTTRTVEEQQKQATETKFLAANTVVYGYWSGNSSIIEATDLSTNLNTILAVLPNNIKHIKILSNNELIFLKDTDSRDYGKSLVTYRIDSKKETVIATATNDFGIDDYVVSENGKYVAIWEAKPPQDSNALLGGSSKIYSVDMSSPGQKNLIYDEASTPGNPIHYPVAITNSGNIYTDRFLPNSGTAWAYGMSVSNFTGTTRSDISSMQNGTYATQPVMSPDEKWLAFVGYDGSRGNGTQSVRGYRKALSAANTVEVLDLGTNTRKKLVSLQGGSTVHSATWDLTTGDILYDVINPQTKSLDMYSYSLSQSAPKLLDYAIDSTDTSYVDTIKTTLAGNKLLITNVATSNSALGNLGSQYEQSLKTMYVFDPKLREREEVSLGSAFVQFIALAGPKYFASSQPGSNLVAQDKNQLQLGSFMVKPSLAPKRTIQQTLPPPKQQENPEDVQACSEQMQQGCSALEGPDNTTCMVNASTCNHSPLYLYGPKGTRISMAVGVPIYSPNTPYSPDHGLFDIALLENGKFSANGTAIESLSFEYTPAIKKLSRPEYGVLTKNAEIEKTIRDFAVKLGLNEKETQDTVNFAKENVTSPYAYLSFYYGSLSKQILPLYFSPQPDNYHNIVFYFERLNSPAPQPKSPTFEKIKRGGFTAVEISYVLR